MDSYELEMKLNKALNDWNIFVDELNVSMKDGRECPVVFYEEDKPFDCYRITYHISWGDWKHDHLVSKEIINDTLKSLGMDVLFHNQITTEEDGSDCYSARHTIYSGVLK